jgi:hypothetical protein
MLRITRFALLSVLMSSAAGVAIACGSFSGQDSPAETADGSKPADDVSVAEADAAPAPPCVQANVASDRNHCGRCDHSCLGGDCVAGVCQPFVVATSVGEPILDVAVDAKRVLWMTSTSFWSGPGHVYSCPKKGCATATSLAVDNALTGNLAAGDSDAFVSFVYGSQGIKRIPPTGVLTDLGAPSHPAAVRLLERNGHLFYLTRNEATAFGGVGWAGSVFEWDGAKEVLRTKFDGLQNRNGLTVVGDDIFLSSYGEIGRCASTGCVAFTTATGGVAGITTDATRVIWISYELQEVRSCMASDATCNVPTTILSLVETKSRPLHVTVSRGTLYVTTSKGDIFACDPANCVLTPVAHEGRLYVGQEYTYGTSVVADDTAIYWAAVDGQGAQIPDGDGGTVEDTSKLTHRIMRLAK